MDDVLITRLTLAAATLATAVWVAWGLPRALLSKAPERPLEAALAGLAASCLVGVLGAIVAFCPGHAPLTQVMLATGFTVAGTSLWFAAWIRG
ncbi:MAG: hypothetical protein VKO21_03605 [Candidatus Sericytochromatia bacterium]|nr:hypothetical protein [Candidatus Sericytochromatia bacterium]